ncbi:MAG: BON domain-containing protein [Rhodobacteraceae bacterium]|uniref:BON domain-containing protein n=1 Tax=Salipiger thiooxidans TaxID=282683 RepID=UPI001A8CE461|nr:BON domain-containing protein [Salipiger thiooxidans]MBN8189756.1 BON domain-containing protein [Salipiger thiooxidans]MBR9840534.1 BON domain-containing protein [Paracoccaceae bacterium]
MPGKPTSSEDPVRVVPSDHAEPSRPGGRHGVRQPVEPIPPAVSGKRPETDRELAAQVLQALGADGRLKDQGIDVTASSGVVTLTGKVALEFQRTLAAAVVQPLAGVLVVENHLRTDEDGAADPAIR